ncbi:uncharacterized protein LOC134191133 isoform X2 [Corticium candelabrum]|uniref:uncharacterized protein LOC134191133 isoform X2 n=1 Tax=Corticium candelabrum TaxID=121492 RepID=UPI002E26FB66|nr:uncharacterized protein LOC134191133 isoform X2 [Corticium candelabrum]
MTAFCALFYLIACSVRLGRGKLLQAIPILSNDFFELSTSGDAVQLRHDDQQQLWKSAVNVAELRLLRNDYIAYWEPQTCVEKRKSEGKSGVNESGVQVTFVDVAERVGFTHSYRLHAPARPHCLFDFNIPILNSSDFVRLKGEFCLPEQLSGAAAVGDYDADGLPDVFFTVFNGRSKLYRNNGSGTFLDVTDEARVGPMRFGSGAAWADFDADGDLDLYVTSVGDTRHFLYINQGGRFTEEAIERNCTGSQPDGRRLSGMTPNVGDFNRDGYPDLYITEWILHPEEKHSSSRLFKNVGIQKPGYFEDVTYQANVDVDKFTTYSKEAPGTFTFCSSMTDFDEDGWPELLVTTDYGNSKMFWNNRNGTFHECTEACGLTARVDAMGHAIGDWNGDTHLDWFSTGIHDPKNRCSELGCSFSTDGNSLYRNANAGGHGRWFVDVANEIGVEKGWWGWGTTMFDFNNDKYIDFIMTNGFDSTTTTTDDMYATDLMLLWMNRGLEANLTTEDVARNVGLNNSKEGRGLAKFDFDGDGDEDVVVSHLIGKPSLFENVGGNWNFWLRVRVVHQCPGRVFQLCDSLHARVEVTSADGWKQTQEIGSGAHFMAQNEIEAHFGLGNNSDGVRLYVYWPSYNTHVTYTNVLPNNQLKVVLPRVGHNHVNSTINYRQLIHCPQLQIASVEIKSGLGAFVWINPSRQTIGVRLDDSSFVQVVLLEYTVTVDPPYLADGLNATAVVYIEIEETDVVTEQDGHCNHQEKATSARRLDGISNNQNRTMQGSATRQLARDMPSHYGDGIATPASQCTAETRSSRQCYFSGEFAGEGSTRPSARKISNKLFHQIKDMPSERHLSDMLTQWGQFLVHDTDFSSPLPRFEFQTVRSDVWAPISIPKFDVHFDPYGTGNEHMPFIRSTYDRGCSGRAVGLPREQINKITSYIDASMVYGLSEEIVKKLRTLTYGKMKLQNNGIIPFNTFGLANDNPLGRPATTLLAAGDTRSNVQPGLIALHSLFVREHNRQCDIYLNKFPNATDDETFAAARQIVIAEIQAITFREFLPALFGRDMPPYRGYDPEVNADAGNSFATAAFRYGHSQVNTHLLRFDKDWDVISEGHLPLRDSYFAPERVIHEGGIEPLLRGFVYQPAQEIDTKMVDDLRNVLFPVGRRDGLDLAALNIQRGRDHGLPSYNQARRYLKLPALKNFSDISSDEQTVSILEQLYPTVDDIDLWVGGLSEDKPNGSSLGQTFEVILLHNFLKFRDGDRFWYERLLSDKEIEFVEKNLTLSQIICLNTDFDDVPENVMFSMQRCAFVRQHQCISKPAPSVACPQQT